MADFTLADSALPEKLALWLVFRPLQLRWEGNGGADHQEVSGFPSKDAKNYNLESNF